MSLVSGRLHAYKGNLGFVKILDRITLLDQSGSKWHENGVLSCRPHGQLGSVCFLCTSSPHKHKKWRPSVDCSLTWRLKYKSGPLIATGLRELTPALALDPFPDFWLLHLTRFSLLRYKIGIWLSVGFHWHLRTLVKAGGNFLSSLRLILKLL